ncbi:hypothetical protein F441_03249 [Phytophthora nicotianae CJ01A1]|uniref:Uncharacterized protein n=2 Tax=Phytophthora nicotianae TaxID=4792 RepID=W2XMC8_PHYNI|nr:hypothetical protein L915_03147 [Phytophthora nicotianae]ETP23642.1 hypothetical protein F441_03249 [Phytophthora nicotianae CJ01A1]
MDIRNTTFGISLLTFRAPNCSSHAGSQGCMVSSSLLCEGTLLSVTKGHHPACDDTETLHYPLRWLKTPFAPQNKQRIMECSILNLLVVNRPGLGVGDCTPCV